MNKNFNSEMYDERDLIDELSVRLILKDKEKFNNYLLNLETKYKHNLYPYLKLGNHDVTILIRDFPMKDLFDLYINQEKENKLYLFKEEWIDMLSSSPCTEFHFFNESTKFFRCENIKDDLSNFNKNAICFCNNLKDRLPDIYEEYLTSIVSTLSEFASGEYSDYLYIQLSKPIKMLINKMNNHPKIEEQKSEIDQIINIINNIINESLNTNLHTHQLPISPIQSSNEHSLLVTYYSMVLNQFVQYTYNNNFLFKDQNGNPFNLSFILYPCLQETIQVTCCFPTDLPEERLLLIYLPLQYINHPDIVFPVCLHELSHYLDFIPRQRNKKILNFAISIINYFSFYLERKCKEAGIDTEENLISQFIVRTTTPHIILKIASYTENQCYFSLIKDELYNTIKNVLECYKDIIIGNVLKNRKQNSKVILSNKTSKEILIEAFDNFFNQNNVENLQTSIHILEYVYNEAFSDISMIIFMGLTSKQYSSLIEYIVDNNKMTRSIFRFAGVFESFDFSLKDCEENAITKNIKKLINAKETMDDKSKAVLSENQIYSILSYDYTRTKLKEYLKSCINEFETLKQGNTDEFKDVLNKNFMFLSNTEISLYDKIIGIYSDLNGYRNSKINSS